MTATVLRTYHAQPKQLAWHRCPAYESGFGGAKFGGKSLALLMEAIRYAGHPAYRGIIFRRTYPRLQELVDRCWLWLPNPPINAHWDGDAHRWVFPSGAMLAMRHCQHEEDKAGVQGHEYQFVGFDQLEEFSETQYLFILAQNRSGVAQLQPYTRSTFNPGGVGHGWVKRRFIDHGTTTCAPWHDHNEEGKELASRCFHFANIDDNPAGQESDPSYRARLESLPTAERRALLHGDWDVFAGQVFSEWRRERHVCEPFAIPAEWPRWIGYDYGSHAPACCLWLARAPSGTVYVYRELYVTSLTDAQQGARIRALTQGETLRFAVGDPSCFSRQPNGTTIASTLAVGLLPGNNDRLAGWQRLHEYLRWDDEQASPRLQVFSSCANLLRTLPALIYDEHRVEDVDSDGEDHAADALRYALMGASVPARPGGQREFRVVA